MIRTALIFLLMFFYQLSQAQKEPVSIRIDPSKTVGPMVPFWTYFGYDEPNFTTRQNGQKLLT